MNNHLHKSSALLFAILFFSTGCASLIEPSSNVKANKVDVTNSYLKDNDDGIKDTAPVKVEQQDEKKTTFERVNSLEDGQSLTLEVDLSKQFNNSKQFQVSVNALPLNEFIHYSLGELLQVSYLIEPSIKSKATPVTLELKEKVTAQRYFQLVQEIFTQNKISITLNDGVYYIFPADPKGSKSDVAFGFGRTPASVPNVASDIVQLVPTKYGVSTGLRSAIAGLVDAQVSIDPAQGMVTIKGKREQVLRAISLINLMDSAAMNKKAVALMKFSYIDSQTFITKVTELLALEGIDAQASRSTSASVYFIPIEHLGQVVVFATADEIIDRVEYWQKELDKPATGAEQSFYIYHPKYARASDLGQSLAPLLGGSFNSKKTPEKAATDAPTPSNASSQTQNNTVSSIEGDDIRLVVDERANALIFYSTGQYYQELQPIIRQLDVMPKQVMMEVVIAEVKLTGSFSKGVQYAIESGEATGRKESFSFNTEGGGAFNYSIVGLPGNISVNLSQTDGLVNVLSRPTLLVRDGVAANISVGDDIPTIGSTTTDPISGDRQTTQVEYRKTGVDLTVTPTINAQGTVIMTIEQNISNISPDSSGAGDNPSIFERTLSTEVVAGNGQTVMLGGLISENKSNGASSVPFFGDLPVLGHLFRTDSSSSDKTELVILVTPKIVQNREDWQRVKDSFIKGLENIAF
ncbi:secretin N-terminal domain-containing protein [Pseudoalteromonas sp. CF6-2]|uniref:secretin N-terminal domain-containing protein n=1 Tax=unclassified Pseudoalteromonas TaxID=194690 RepID=UPI001F1FF244|nr:type II secretory pathway protein [Pseudoalteromonas sp. CF6-2]